MHLRLAAALLAVVALAGCGGGGKKASPAPAAADAVVKTSEGTFTIRLDVKDSPNAVASFEKLAKKGFFKGTIFHRIVPGFVIQGGDPTGTGTGGPGYTTTDPPPTNARYTHGVVAMAKTATESPGTAGSQFFVVTARTRSCRRTTPSSATSSPGSTSSTRSASSATRRPSSRRSGS